MEHEHYDMSKILNPGSIWVGGAPKEGAILTPAKWLHVHPAPNALKIRSIIRKAKQKA